MWTENCGKHRRNRRDCPIEEAAVSTLATTEGLHSKIEWKERPLGIPTMRDRAMQALYLLALDPVLESVSDPNYTDSGKSAVPLMRWSKSLNRCAGKSRRGGF